MWVRVLGVATVLAALGVAGGYAAGQLLEDEPVRLASTAPLPAEPSYPSDPPPVVVPDPAVPPLPTGLPLEPVQIGSDQFPILVPVPVGWTMEQSEAEWRWYPPVFEEFTYFIRVRSIASNNDTIARAKAERIHDLDSASAIDDLRVEQELAASFLATYVAGEHRRVDLEQFFSLSDDDAARVSVAIVGREVDRAGMQDLLSGIAAGISR